tara:strand:- start:3773 stop:4009 length:237 start_codon:yes stop_codon:yes gene_type:complete
MVTKKEHDELQQQYDLLLQEALALQEVAKQRLILLKVFESFFNSVNAIVARTRVEFNELQTAQVQQINTEQAAIGDVE